MWVYKDSRNEYEWNREDGVFESEEKRKFELGQIRVINGKLWYASGQFIYTVQWSPVTKDMLHVPEERKGEDE